MCFFFESGNVFHVVDQDLPLHQTGGFLDAAVTNVLLIGDDRAPLSVAGPGPLAAEQALTGAGLGPGGSTRTRELRLRARLSISYLDPGAGFC